MHTRTVSFFIIVALAATAGVALACRDDTTAPRGNARTPDRAPSRTTHPNPAASGDARAELRKANPMEWVGVAHNAALDAFLEELNKPGVLTKDICGHILDFSAREERAPTDRPGIAKRLDAGARRDVARKAFATSALCGSVNQSASSPAIHLKAPPARQSSAAYSLLSQVEYAINAAVDSYDLAARLNPVLNAATSLPYEEYVTVAATVSVAQSSYEYWQTGYRTYYDGIRRDYGACADQMKYAGYSAYDARNYCMGSSSTTKSYSELRRRDDGTAGRPVALMFLRATPGTSRQCISAGAGLKQIGRDDARGAFTAGFAGLLIGGPEAAALAGIAGGAANSIATGIGLVWNEMWNCGGSGGTKTYR